MKFAEHLGTHLTPEWRSQYIKYEEMKKLLYKASENSPSVEEFNDEVLQRHFTKHEEEFFRFCGKEIKKINSFFAEKLAEAVRRFNDLENELANAGITPHLNQSIERLNEATNDDQKSHLDKKKTKELKHFVSEYYLSLVLIQNYQQLNFTGFRKILKKHDKIFQCTSGSEYRDKTVIHEPFHTDKSINQLILDTEKIAIEIEGGDRTKAMKRLRVPPLSEKKNHTEASFLSGLFLGSFVVLFVVVIFCASFKGKHLNWEPAFRMYRGLFLIFFMIGLLGINVRGWNEGGVNHVLIFELDPRNHLQYVDILMLSAFLGVVWCLSCLAFLFSDDFNLPIFAQPIACWIFYLLFFLNPTRTFKYSARRWLLRILTRIFIAPFCPIRFADFWVADQLNSLVVALKDFQYFICFAIYSLYQLSWYDGPEDNMFRDPRNVIRPIVALLPAWWRFAQCVRRYHYTKRIHHMVNAGKYSTSIIVTIISTLSSIYEDKEALFYLWVISLICATFYTLYWDIRKDWGLLAENAGENKFLREQIVYNYKTYYYLAILADLIFRFLWTLTVSDTTSGVWHNDFFTFFIAVCEVIRRFIWNFFRLENEHLNNVGEFRAVRDISIKPIIVKEDSRENLSVEQIMDAEDGPSTRKKSLNFMMKDRAEGRDVPVKKKSESKKLSSVLKII